MLANLSKLQELDSELDETVLRLRDALLNNYDPLVATLASIKAYQRDLQQGEYAVARVGEARLAAAMAAVAGKLAEKEALIEQFKSRNALLRNSYHYFPASVEALRRDPRAAPPLRSGAQDLLRDVLLLRLGASPDDYKVIALQVEQFGREHEGLAEPVRMKTAVLLQHAKNVIEHQAQVDRLVHDITAPGVKRTSASLAEAYNRVFERKLREAGVYRFVLVLACLTLLAYAASSFMRLRQSTAKLHRALGDQAREMEEREQAEEKLRLAALALENAAEGVMISDERRRVVTVNKAFTRITGYAPEEVLGRESDFLRSGDHELAFYEKLWAQVKQNGAWQGEVRRRRKDGAVYPEWRSISAVRDDAGNLTHFVAVFSDISQEKQTQERLHFLAHHDALTGLPNRVLFADRVQEALTRAQRRGKMLALLFIDLDRFKDVNDSLGHGTGDALLQAVAVRLKAAVRDTDTLARLGGDEFTILVEELAESQHAARIAEKVLAALSQQFVLGDQEIFVSGSVGISCYPQDGSDAQSLLKNADAAMYRAKEQGRDNFQFFSSEMNARAMEKLVMTNQLRAALERDEFLLHYQPIIDLGSGRVNALEALVRWRHPTEGLVPPGRFIPLAEDSGLIVPIGYWVLRTACARMKAWSDAGIAPRRIAVNLSARQFKQKDLVQRIEAILRQTGLGAQQLELEITESMVMEDPAQAEKVLQQLHESGISLAMDDFGTGYSSLSYLKRFPIDFLKIDRSFVRDIPQSADDMAIARAIIALAKSLELRVIAEGVETDAQRTFLDMEHCDEVQGYLLGRPADAEAIERTLREPYAR